MKVAIMDYLVRCYNCRVQFKILEIVNERNIQICYYEKHECEEKEDE